MFRRNRNFIEFYSQNTKKSVRYRSNKYDKKPRDLKSKSGREV